MSTLAASNLDEPPPKINQSPSMSSSLFSSLPNDIILEILARVPKRYYPVLSCLSKKLQILVRSPEIEKTRALIGTDSLYISFDDGYASTNWFTLCRMELNPAENLFVPIDFPLPPHSYYSSVIAVSPEIFFIGGSFGVPSSSLWILDSRSGKFRQGPNMQVEHKYTTVGLVGCKIYVIGVCERNLIHAEFFDLKTQTWNPAPIPKDKGTCTWICRANVALDRKVFALRFDRMTCYDTINGSCERFELAANSSEQGECVIDNVLYVYYNKLGLKWYDFKLRQWRVVNGLDHLNMTHQSVCMGEYYGKLAFMWTESDGETKKIWCRMIALDKSEEGIHGTAEPSQLLGTVPHGCFLKKCLSLANT